MKRTTTFLAKALLMLFAAFFSFTGARGAYEVEIGDGGEDFNIYLPSFNYYNYSLSQQIYTAAEIGTDGTIHSIAFKNIGAEKTRTYSVYMLHTDKETFESGNDWVSMSNADLVFSGDVTFAVGSWTEINLEAPFDYDGISNLIIGVADNTGNYSNSPHMACLVFDATGQAIHSQRHDSAYDISAPGYSGEVMNLKNQIVLDITPSGGTTVEAPATFEVPMVTENSARLTWTGGTGVFNVEYKKVADTEWTRVLSNSPLFTYVLSGLETGTKYYARVQSVSGSDVSAWKYATFTTNYVVPFPFLEDFENGMPSHWNRYLGLLESVLAGDATLETIYNSWVVGDKNGVLNGKHAYLNIWGDVTKYWLVTPAIPVESNAHLAFDVAYTLYYGTAQAPKTTGDDDKFVVLVSTDGMATWTILRQWDNAGSAYVLNDLTPSAQYISLDLDAYAGKSVNVAFYGESTIANADNDIHIDNFAVETKPTCERPSAFNASGVTGHTATLTWTGGTGIYNLEYKKTADTEWTRKLSSTTSTTCTLTGLEAETTYQARVQSVGGGGTSGWSTVNFTTTTACPAPTNPVCTAVTATSATLDWTENGIASRWEICLNDDEENLIEITSKPYILTGLTEETEYTFKVRACNSDTEKSAWSANGAFQPTSKWVIGSGTATGAYLPTYTYYYYSLTQQIYTAAELGDAANIRSIDFYSTATERTRNLDIYMVATDKESFATKTDWVPVAAGDLVFSGEVTFLQNAWTTIELDKPFEYAGTSNVVLVVDDNTGSEVSSPSFRVFDATAQALRAYADGINFDPFAPPTEGSNLAILNVKNQIRLVKGEAPSVLRPTGLTVSYTGGLEATVSWVSEEPSFDIDVNGTVTEDVANPTTLTGLSYATIYNIKVRAKNSKGVSGWTGPVSFATKISDDMCQIKLELTDYYGDGWSDNAIKIVDVATGIVIGTCANQDLDGSPGVEVNTLYASVPNDRDIEFQFVKGYHANECSWAVYDVNDELIFEGTFVGQKNDEISSGTLYTWHVDCTVSPYRRPTGLVASEIGSRKATLSWTENGTATAWVIEVTDNNAEATTYVDASENPFTVTGLNPETEYFVKVRPAGENAKWSEGISFTTGIAFPAPTELAADNITVSSAEISWTGNEDASRYNLRYRVTPSSVIDFEDSSMGEWTTIDADGDGYDWVLGSEVGGIYLTEGSSLAGSGNDSSLDFVTSGSYSNPAGTALTPDNWLVSPLVKLGGIISFCASGQDEEWAAEHFGVAVSTTSNTDPAAFTMLDEWTLNADGTGSKSSRRKTQGVWGMFTVDLSDYAGQTGYVAIRHFNCTDQFLLNIDDITIEQPAGAEEPWTVVNNAANPYTIEGLSPETKYTVQVQAVYAGGESEWKGTSFVTLEEFPTPVNLSVKAGSRTAELSWTERGTATEWEICLNGDEENLIPADSNPFTLIDLMPLADYTVKVRAINGEKKSHWSASVKFSTDIAFPAPTELAAESVTNKSAVITWTSDASATGTELEFAAFPTPTDLEWKQYDDDTYKGNVGGSFGTWMWGVMYPAITGNALTKVSIFEATGNTEDITIYIAEGGDDEPETYLYKETITPEAANAFHEIRLAQPVELTPGENLWVILEENGTYPMVGCDAYSEPNNTWIYSSGWDHITDYGLNYGWMIRAEVGNTDFGSVSWSPDVEATSPYKLEGLTPETLYSVAVKSIYGTEGESDWTYMSFVTAEGTPVPTNITADLAADGATLTWEGTGDSYNVQYRTADESRKFFEDYFEAGLDQWTLITEGEGEGWIIDTSSETHGATSYSWKDDVAYNVNNWLITPQIEFGGILHFNVTVHPDYPDSYEVLLSTTGNGTTDFTTVLQPMAKGKTGNVNIDLSDYDGQKGYIAIHHVDKDSYLLFIDNFYVYDAVPAGEWQTMAVTEPTATISGLVNNRLYEYQVQSVKDGSTSEWSDAGEFVLLTLDSNTDNTKLIKKYENKLAHVTLANRILYKDDGWNALTLPFDLSPEQLAASPLADADFRTFNGVTVEGTKATLSFTEKGELDSSGLIAGKPYIIQWANDSNIENPEFANVTIKSEPQPVTYKIGSVYVSFLGIYYPLTFVGENKSILFIGAEDKLFWPTAGTSIPAQSAYFTLWGDIEEIDIKEFNIPTPDQISEYSENSEYSEDWYDLGGRKLAGKPSMKGIYVNGGRKISIK